MPLGRQPASGLGFKRRNLAEPDPPPPKFNVKWASTLAPWEGTLPAKVFTVVRP